jgi:hypothetical protein
VKDKLEKLKQYTKDDFIEKVDPYEFVYSFKGNGFELEKALTKVSQLAQKQGVRNFKKMFQEYVKSVSGNMVHAGAVVEFELMPDTYAKEYQTDKWIANETGIKCFGAYGEEQIACVHPILPVERLINIDTQIEKVRICYKKGVKWRSIIVDRRTLASANQIIALADNGIAVNSENSKLLVQYLHDMEHLNYKIIEEKNCVTRLGWIDGEGFSPYVKDLQFDGDFNHRVFFDSVKPKGKYNKWLNAIKDARAKNIYVRLIVAASFASVLVKPFGLLPFFVHLWGGTEAGKTVGLMAAASVWGRPELGHFIHSFNSTAVGRERSAAFVNNLPLILDELQVIKDKKQFDQEIYMLCEGVGKVRGNKTGGTDQTPIWSNCILTNGEMPITNQNSGGGAVNRILEIECQGSLFEDPREFCNVVKANYGHAGEMFVNHISDVDTQEEMYEVFKTYNKKLSENDTTEKQAMAGALLLTVDLYLSKWFFGDGEMKVSDIKPFLQTKSEVSVNVRGADWLVGWIAQNKSRFLPTKSDGPIYGKIEGNKVYIINNIFNDACSDAGFNSRTLLSYLSKSNMLKEGTTKSYPKSINGILTRCFGIILDCDIEDEPDEELKHPF